MDKPFLKLKEDTSRAKALKTYFRHQWYMIHNVKKNMLSLTTGGSGDGKSWSTIIHNYFLDPRFNLDKIIFNEHNFYKALDNVKYVGEFVMWDEAGVGIPAKEWYKVSNKAIGKTLQIFRADTRIGLTFTTQDMSFIDSQSRKLLNYFFMMEERTKPDHSKMWIRKILVNRAIGKMYMPYPRLRIDGLTYRFKNMTFNIDEIRKDKDLDALLTDYDKRSKPIKRKLREEQQKLVNQWAESEQQKLVDSANTKIDLLTQIRNKVIHNPQPYINARGSIDVDLIRSIEGITNNDAVTVKKIIDKALMEVPISQASSEQV